MMMECGVGGRLQQHEVLWCGTSIQNYYYYYFMPSQSSTETARPKMDSKMHNTSIWYIIYTE